MPFFLRKKQRAVDTLPSGEKSHNQKGARILKKKANLVLFVGLLAILSSGFACQSADVTRAAVAADNFVDAVGAFQDTEIVLYEQGFIDEAEHRTIQTLLVDVANAGPQANNAIRLAKSEPELIEAVNFAIEAVQALDEQGVMRIKNPDAKARLRIALMTAKGALGVISAMLPQKQASLLELPQSIPRLKLAA